MANVAEHYETVLARHYSWLLGGFDAGVEENHKFFLTHAISPRGSGIAVDLGCGSGFQALPLAQLGFHVIAIDLSSTLLAELTARKGDLPIETVQGDLLDFPQYLTGKAELCVCMGDTLTHLDSRETVGKFFRRIAENLEPEGQCLFTFRDLAHELTELARFLPLRSDDQRIATCYLEYDPEHVKVHDLVYENVHNRWIFKKSFYRKCRIPFEWVTASLCDAGFVLPVATKENGLITIVAQKKDA
ncbi:MAG: class I SAM-dependent methyltransferase [Candidatus Binatia bacterium]